MLRKFIFCLIFLTSFLPVLAQDNPEGVTVTDITYDMVQQDNLTATAFYDWWHIEAAAGDIMVVEMGGEDGLAPLIGILDTTGNLVGRSPDGEPDKTVTMEYTVPADGQYTIVATRVGNEGGTTTGRYAIRVRKANPNTEIINPDQYEDVTFACKDFEATSVVSLHFAEDPHPNLRYRITVYGLDGFVPVIRLKFDVPGQSPFELCNTDADATVSDTFTVPGEAERTITKDNLSTVSQLTFAGAEKAGFVNVTIASKDGKPGRYFAVLDGFSIGTTSNNDTYDVRIGPLAKLTPLTVYMVATANSRLDPYMKWSSGSLECDDAGRGACKNVPSFDKAGVTLHDDGGMTIKGDRSDAGLVLAPGTTDIMSVEMSSRENDTYGDYALFLLGELPAAK